MVPLWLITAIHGTTHPNGVVTIGGTPRPAATCQESEYRAYVLAHLPNLKYLDYRLVDEQAVISARELYQEELLDLEEQVTS